MARPLSLGALVFIVVMGAVVTRRQIAAIGHALQGDQRGLAGDVAGGKRVAMLWSSFLIRALLLLSIVLLMSTRPGWWPALLIVTTAATVALVASLPFWRGASRLSTEERA